MGQSSNLYRLQQIDSRSDQVHARMREIEHILAENTELAEAEQRASSAEKLLQEAQKELRQAENQAKDQRIKIGQNEAALYGGKVRNPKELQDLQNEAAALKRYLVVLEDRLLEAMIAVEEAEGAAEVCKQELLQTSARVIEQQATLRAEQMRLGKDVERLNIERIAALSAIPESDLELYNHLRQVRGGVAVARVVDRSCSACGSMMTPAAIQAANISTQVTRCGTCGRILYGG